MKFRLDLSIPAFVIGTVSLTAMASAPKSFGRAPAAVENGQYVMYATSLEPGHPGCARYVFENRPGDVTEGYLVFHFDRVVSTNVYACANSVDASNRAVNLCEVRDARYHHIIGTWGPLNCNINNVDHSDDIGPGD